MTFHWTPRFQRAYHDLSSEHQAVVEEHLRMLEKSWRHPSLRAKKLPGAPKIWYIRVSRDIRLTFEPVRTEIFLRNVGRHDEVLRSP